VAINQSILQGQGVGQQIGGVSPGVTQYVQEVVERQQTNGTGGGGGGGGFGSPSMAPETDWSSMAWLILGML